MEVKCYSITVVEIWDRVRMDGADGKRALHTRLADEDDEATAGGRVTTSCLQCLWIRRDNNTEFQFLLDE